MKETYETPSVEIVLLNFSDVITASGAFTYDPSATEENEGPLMPID